MHAQRLDGKVDAVVSSNEQRDGIERERGRHVGELQHGEPVFLSQHANGHIPVGILRLLHLFPPLYQLLQTYQPQVWAAPASLFGWLISPLQRGELVSVYRSRRICQEETRQTRSLFADMERQYDGVLRPAHTHSLRR
jgi:hypothetical protein